MELAAHREKTDTTDAALRAGLRAIAGRSLPSYEPGHTRGGRLWFVAFLALSVGPAFEVVAIAPELVARVGVVLAHADGEIALERLASWVEAGGAHA